MSADNRLTLPCADTKGDSVHFTRLTDTHEGLMAVTAIEDDVHVVVHLAVADQRRLRDFLAETLGESGHSTEDGAAR